MWYTLRKEEAIQKLKTNGKNGLTDTEVMKREKEYGKNKLEEKKKESLIVKFFKQFNDFMIIILIIASIISALVSKMQGENDYFDSIIIIAIVIVVFIILIPVFAITSTIDTIKSFFGFGEDGKATDDSYYSLVEMHDTYAPTPQIG